MCEGDGRGFVGRRRDMLIRPKSLGLVLNLTRKNRMTKIGLKSNLLTVNLASAGSISNIDFKIATSCKVASRSKL